LAVGTHSITAVYNGGNYDPATSAAKPQAVSKAETTTTAARASGTTDPSPFSAPVTYTATVAADAPGTGTPSGTVEFKDGASVITGCATAPLTAGGASCDTSGTVVAGHTITTTYSGDDSYLTSDDTLSQEIAKADTATVLTSSDPTTTSNEAVTYTATVSLTAPAITTPSTGTVGFTVDATPIAACAAQLVTGGIATCETVSEPVGGPVITAVFSGTSDFNPSTATGITQTVGNADTATAVTVAPVNTAFSYGDDITLTATISPVLPATAAPDAVGTVTFLADAVPVTDCEALDVETGTATCMTNDLAAGIPSITASYSGGAGFNSSTSSGDNVTIAPAESSTDIASSANPSVFGASVTFTASVSATAPGNSAPDGTVTFGAGGVDITGCVAMTLSSGSATCATDALPSGNSSITAVYAASANYLASTSTALAQTVGRQSTTTALLSSDASTTRSELVTFTATMAPVAPATSAPAGGEVAFKVGGTSIAGCTARPVTTGVATCITAALPVGPALSITAVYSGDPTSAASTSSAISQAVAKATATNVLTTSDATVVSGDAVTLTATLTQNAPATTPPSSGTVSFNDNGTAISACAAQPISAGVATCTTSTLGIGAHPLTAIAAATDDFTSTTSGAVTQMIGRVATHTAMTPLDTPAKFGKSVRFSVNLTSIGTGHGTPTGVVALYRTRANGSREWIGRVVIRNGAGVIKVSGMPIGLHLIVAEYRGTVDFVPSHRSARQRIDR
jgi:hypothetical protein